MFRKQELFSRNREKPVSAVSEARSYLSAVPRSHSDTRATWLQRVSRFYDISASLAKKLWYFEIERMDADTLLRMRERSDELMRSAQRRQELLNDVDAVVGAATRLAGQEARRKGLEGGATLPARGEEAGSSAAAAVRPTR